MESNLTADQTTKLQHYKGLQQYFEVSCKWHCILISPMARIRAWKAITTIISSS